MILGWILRCMNEALPMQGDFFPFPVCCNHPSPLPMQEDFFPSLVCCNHPSCPTSSPGQCTLQSREVYGARRCSRRMGIAKMSSPPLVRAEPPSPFTKAGGCTISFCWFCWGVFVFCNIYSLVYLYTTFTKPNKDFLEQ